MKTKLHYAGNLFIKEIELNAGESFPSHKHKFDHMSHVAFGKVRVTVNEHSQEFSAPHTLLVKAHKNHSILALEPSRWLCIHAIKDEYGNVIPDNQIEYSDRATLPTPLTYDETMK